MCMYILCIFCIAKDKERTDSSIDLGVNLEFLC